MPYKNQIKLRLRELGETQEWLSKLTSIRRDYLSKLINGHFKPNVYDALSISTALDSTVEALFSPPLGQKEEKDHE